MPELQLWNDSHVYLTRYRHEKGNCQTEGPLSTSWQSLWFTHKLLFVPFSSLFRPLFINRFMNSVFYQIVVSVTCSRFLYLCLSAFIFSLHYSSLRSTMKLFFPQSLSSSTVQSSSPLLNSCHTPIKPASPLLNSFHQTLQSSYY